MFITKFFKDSKKMGAILPSSHSLAKVITEEVSQHKSPKRILEVGSGSGVFTEEIVKQITQDDLLDLVEIDLEFTKELEKKYRANPNIKVNNLAISKWNPTYKYDVIVSSIPMNFLQPEELESLLKHYQNLCKKNGAISYVEYLLFPHLRIFYDKSNYNQTRKILNDFHLKHTMKSQIVWNNLPPAIVYTIKL